jgi:hypothetical protein
MGPGFRQDDIESVATASFNFKQPNGAGAIAPAPPVLILGSIVMVVMVVMVVMMPVGHPDDDARPISVVMVMVVVVLREPDVSVPRRRRLLLVERLQQRARIRDRLQQVGIGIGL